MKKILFQKIHRPLVVYFCILFVMGILPVRLLVVGNEYKTASEASGSKSLTVAESRGIIYDRRMRRLTCDSVVTVSVIKPSLSALNALKNVLDSESFDAVSDEISKQNPLLLRIGNSVESEDIMSLPIYSRYNTEQLASHIVGYLADGGDTGISGIEKSFNKYLSSYSGELRARFFADANGTVLSGADFELENNNYDSSAGVVLTIDKEIQSAAEKATQEYGLKKGAVVVMDIESGEIVAAVSRPDYDRENIAAALSDESLPLFNRVLGSYPVGSVFKPLVAACALEQGVDPLEEYECRGYTVSGGKTFRCMKNHAKVNMASALAFSCNCYFINLIEKLDVAAVLEAARNLGFCSSIELATDMCTYSGNVPETAELESPAARANFSFGQGSLSANILQVACLYSALANGGEYIRPYLVKGLCDENMNMTESYSPSAPVRVFSQATAGIVGSFLELAVREGTGGTAAAQGCLVAGKTATAQTGEYNNGQERVVTWFAGFFPYEKPRYAAVVLCEDGSSGSADCAPVFSSIADAISNKY